MAKEQVQSALSSDSREISLDQLEEILELQSSILADISAGEDTDRLFVTLCLAAEKLAEGALASVMVFTREPDQLFVHAAPNFPLHAISELNGLRPNEGSCGCAVHHNEPQYVSDTFRDERWANIVEIATNYNVRACWSHPIRDSGDRPIGSFALSSFEHRSPNSFQRRLLSSCASIAGILFQRKSLEKKNNEWKLRLEEENRYSSITVDSIADGVISTDSNGGIKIFNKTAENLTNINRNAAIGKPVDDIFHVTDLNGNRLLFQPFIDSPLVGSKVFENLLLIPKTEERRDIGASVAPIYNGNELSGVVIAFWDTALFIEDKRKLRESEARYRSMIENSADSIYMHDAKGIITGVNQRASELVGYTREELVGMHVAEIEVGFQADFQFSDLVTNLPVNGAVTMIGTHRRKDGSEFPVEVCLSCFLKGSERQYIATARDITDREAIEKERLKASKLESIGILAGGIAHDFNNLLVGVMGNIDLARMYPDDEERIDKYLQRSMDASRRAAGLTQQLLTFAKGGDPVKTNADIVETIRQSCEFALHGGDIECNFEFDSDITTIKVDVSQISQVIQNLIINARQAMPDGGRLTVSCGTCTIDGLDRTLTLTAGQYLKLQVTDTGCGIDEKIIQSIFDPYFTTKHDGSGLGLAVTYSIICKHGGDILVESSRGEGATFTVYLPTDPENLHDIDHVESGLRSDEQSLLVLVMDDEEHVQQVCIEMLETLGHRCLRASNGEEAIEIFSKYSRSDEGIDLVIMDLTVPSGMGGREATQKILEIDPQARAIVSSGYSHDLVIANYPDYGFRGAISKPYTSQLLEKVIGEAMS